MITNDGRNIVAKFLLGQAPEFASHIAAGCGSRPILTSASASISADKQVMDFEVFRVPITSKGFIRQGGEEKLILKAEMPTEQRYIISEVAFFSGPNNALAGNYDSRSLLSFTPSENWLYVTNGITNSIAYITSNIDSDNANSDLNAILSSSPAFFVNSNQTIFNNQTRQDRYEPPRFYNRALLVNGNSASISSGFTIGASATSIENTSAFDFSRNLPGDEIKLAISLISRLSATNTNPDNVRIVIDFVNNLPGETLPPKARATQNLTSANFGTNRYQIITKNISDFTLDDGFSWANVSLTRIYCCAEVSGAPSNDYFIVLDALRLDNVTVENPVYAMVGYDLVKTSDAQPIIKEENSTNYIEYRFGVGVN